MGPGIAVELADAPLAQGDEVLFQLRVYALGVDAVVDFEGEKIARTIGRADGKDRIRDGTVNLASSD